MKRILQSASPRKLTFTELSAAVVLRTVSTNSLAIVRLLSIQGLSDSASTKSTKYLLAQVNFAGGKNAMNVQSSSFNSGSVLPLPLRSVVLRSWEGGALKYYAS